MERLKQVPRSERASVLYKDKLARHGFRVEDCFTETNMLCYYAGPRFFFQSWCDYFTGKRKTLQAPLVCVGVCIYIERERSLSCWHMYTHICSHDRLLYTHTHRYIYIYSKVPS